MCEKLLPRRRRRQVQARPSPGMTLFCSYTLNEIDCATEGRMSNQIEVTSRSFLCPDEGQETRLSPVRRPGGKREGGAERDREAGAPRRRGGGREEEAVAAASVGGGRRRRARRRRRRRGHGGRACARDGAEREGGNARLISSSLDGNVEKN